MASSHRPLRKRTPAMLSRNRGRRRHSCNCRSKPTSSGVIAQIQSRAERTPPALAKSPHKRLTDCTHSPAYADGDGPQIGGDAVTLAVQIAELDVEIHIRAYLARHPAAEVFTKLILAGR